MIITSWRGCLSWRDQGTSNSGSVPVSWGVWRSCGIPLQWSIISTMTGRASPLGKLRLIFYWKVIKYLPINSKTCQKKLRTSKDIMLSLIKLKIWVSSFHWYLPCIPSSWRTDIGSRSRTWQASSLIRRVWLLLLRIFSPCIFTNLKRKSTRQWRWHPKRLKSRKNSRPLKQPGTSRSSSSKSTRRPRCFYPWNSWWKCSINTH